MSRTSESLGSPFSIVPFLSSVWWVLLLRGVLAVIFGVLTFVWPGASLLGLVTVYGVYAMVDGVTALFSAFKSGAASRLMLAVGGLISFAAGLTALAWPGVTAFILVMILGVWSVVRGATEIILAIAVRKEIANEWMLILAGALSILVGLALMAAPGAGATLLLWLIGGWGIAFGLLLIFLSLRLKKLGRR
jgi:uncharacterized membrane protein HdeD (DUF308 family)